MGPVNPSTKSTGVLSTSTGGSGYNLLATQTIYYILGGAVPDEANPADVGSVSRARKSKHYTYANDKKYAGKKGNNYAKITYKNSGKTFIVRRGRGARVSRD